MMKSLSDYLFAQPSFLSGMARIFDFSGSLSEYNAMPTDQEADELAMAVDRDALEGDYRAAFEALLDEYPELRAAG
jgi:hypothetical protein